ncbi:hypothetical protein CDAR_85991 [Caerostris darwini]|uniref:Uncharacterized protein n=1 Tax=Caerostris darwini TaxID=1538125 RepID=A0AAV4V4L6_9ARAC|nr:hypothetical protein CDAR_85991 [Caerostris darwini]
MSPISKQKFQSTAATLAELAPRVALESVDALSETSANLLDHVGTCPSAFITLDDSSLNSEKQKYHFQHNSSTRRFDWMCNKRAATGRNKRSTLTMTERDKVRDAPSLGKQAATGTPFCPAAII